MEEVTVSIPRSLYHRAEHLAQLRDQSMIEALDEAIGLAEAASAMRNGKEARMAQEEAAYRAMHDELMANYQGEYVAIYQGKVVDHDPDELALLARIDEAYPDEIVLLKQVQPLPEKVLQFRSPHFVRDEA